MRNPSEAVEQHLKQLGIISFAIVSGVVIFGGVVWYLLNSGGFTPPDGLPTYLATLFNLMALVALVKAHFLPRLFSAPPPEAPEESRLAWHKRKTILGFAIREGAAFIALVGVLLTGQQAGGFAMAGLAVVTMVFAWPRGDQLQRS
jgi:hypothetical protein